MHCRAISGTCGRQPTCVAHVIRRCQPRYPAKQQQRRRQRAVPCRSGEDAFGQQHDDSNSVSPKSPWSMQEFWAEVNDREASKRYCSKDPDFMRRKAEFGLPDIDWGRYNQQVLFVDRSDTLRARMAAGFFEIVSNWNTLDMVLVQDRCGVDVDTSRKLEPGTTIALVGQASPYGISSRHFTRELQSFEADDFYRYDIIVALDTSVKEDLLSMARVESGSAQTANYLDYFKNKLALLSDFSPWCSDESLSHKGGTAVLPPQLSEMLAPHLAEARRVVDVDRPNLNEAEDLEQWQRMVRSIVMGVAGLLKYLSDACPNDMPHWERLD